VNVLIAAIRHAGLNRTLIRDTLRELTPLSGVTGTMKWDATGQNEADVRMSTCAIIRNKKNGGQ
jgi:ABC-type branched-subunit amino acid transport system substrate-binding protein